MPARKNTWSELSPVTQRKWVARYGGRGDRDIRRRRAQAAYEHGATITREQGGHETARPTIRALVMQDGGVGFVDLAGLSRRTRSRIGRHDYLVRQLLEGNLPPADFQRRVSRWAAVGGHRLVSTPNAVVAAVAERQEAGEELGPYPEAETA